MSIIELISALDPMALGFLAGCLVVLSRLGARRKPRSVASPPDRRQPGTARTEPEVMLVPSGAAG
jgi:hypothetical protein